MDLSIRILPAASLLHGFEGLIWSTEAWAHSACGGWSESVLVVHNMGNDQICKFRCTVIAAGLAGQGPTASRASICVGRDTVIMMVYGRILDRQCHVRIRCCCSWSWGEEICNSGYVSGISAGEHVVYLGIEMVAMGLEVA